MIYHPFALVGFWFSMYNNTKILKYKRRSGWQKDEQKQPQGTRGRPGGLQ
jgi:hypothetical protein